jgi:undecaprenyl-phosphate 4-deoxy-4-formamido-L-arabinose transferase
MKLSVVIPCYRSENTIRGVVNELVTTMQTRPETEYEIILVNDCSPDNVWSVIKEICQENANVRGVCLARNFGQHSALMAGYRLCSGDYIISMDDDGQSAANELFRLVDALEEGYDVVYADYPVKKESAMRLLGSELNAKMNEVMIDKPKGIVPNSYFIVRSFIVKEMLKYENAYPYVDGLIFRATKNIGKVEITHREREEGRSGYTLKKLISLWLNGFTAFSVKPLRFATSCGIICAFLGMLMVIYTVVHKLVNPNVAIGYSSLMSMLLFIGGMIMFMMGLIGEYIGRIYISLNNSPQFVIREIYGQAGEHIEE